VGAHRQRGQQQRKTFVTWEIGNENYGTWEADNNTRPHDPVNTRIASRNTGAR